MTFLTFTIALAAMSAAPSQSTCSLPQGSPSSQRVFTNADLERMSACRYQTGVQSEAGSGEAASSADPKGPRRSTKSTASRPATGAASPANDGTDAAESDWRARWRSVDQKARRLRREATELRQEAAQIPIETKKKGAVSRRSTTFLIGRAQSLENDARELEDEFQSSARREGALPGWLRAR